MPWDPSIALQGAPQGGILPNPLEFFSGLQQLQARQHQNLKFQQENDARVATGQAYSQAVGPDGALDEVKLLELLKNNPAAQFAIPEALAAAQAREKERLAIQQKNLEVGAQRINMFANTIGGLMTKGTDITSTDVHRAVSKLAVQINDPALAKTMFVGLSDMPKGGKELQDWVLQQNAAIMPVVERMNAAVAPPVPVDTGDAVHMLQPNRLAGTVSSMGSLEKFPTPQDMNAPQPEEPKDAVGKPLQKDTAQNTRPLTGGRGTPVNPGVTAAGKPVGPAPAALATEMSTMEDLNKYISGLHGQMSNLEQNIKQIGSMRGLLDNIRTGPFAEKRLVIAKAFQGLGFPSSVTDIINGGDISKAEEFAKKSFDEAYMGLKAMTPPGTQLTNGEVMAKWQNSPRLDMNPQAIEDLFNYSVEVFKYKQAERDFLNDWRRKQEHPSEAQAAWTREAIKRELIKPEARDRGAPPGVLSPRETLSRGPGVPGVAFVTDAELSSSVPDGKTAIIDLPTGPVKVRRRGNSFEVVR